MVLRGDRGSPRGGEWHDAPLAAALNQHKPARKPHPKFPVKADEMSARVIQ